MENKIKLIDIIENPLDLTEKIIVDMLENKGTKYINLMSAIITRAMYEEDPKFERDKVKFIVTGISKDSLIPMMSSQSLLKTESYKFDLIESRYIANVKESVVMFDDYAFDGYIKEKYKFDPYRVFDIDKEILHRLDIYGINLHSLRVRSVKFIYTAIMIFVKSKYVKDLRGLGKSLITSIDINEDMIYAYDKPYCDMTAIYNFKIGLLRGKLYPFISIRNVPSILYSIKIANQTLTITDNITNYRMSTNMDSSFSTDKCFCLELGVSPNYNIINPVYIDMEYIANEMEKAYNIELEKYNKIDKNVIDKPVSSMRLKESLKNSIATGEFNDIKIRNKFIWSLLSLALKNLYKPSTWTALLSNNDFVYYHNLKQRVFIKNISDAIHQDDIDIVYNIIEKLNSSVISSNINGEDNYYIELFMMDLVEYVLDLKLDSKKDHLQVWKDLVGLNKALEFNSESEDSKAKVPANYKIKDLVLRNYEVADAYVFNVILRNGIWELPIAEDDEDLMLVSINKYNAKFDTTDPDKIRPSIVNAVKNLLEYQSRKMLYRVLLNAVKYIHKYTGNIHLNALMYSDFINVFVDVNKVISEAGRLNFANKNNKSPQSFDAINSLVDVFRINERKCNNPEYIEIKNFMGRYVDMGETYYIIKDILFIYFCLLFSDKVGYDKNVLLDGLTIGGLDAKFVNHSKDNIVKFSPLDDVGIEGRDRELKNYGYNPENIPFLLRYRKTLTSEHLKDFAKDVHYIDKKNINNSLDKLEELWNKQVCFDEMTFSRNNTDRKSTRRDRYLALMVELGEILKEDECYKYWKSSKHTLDNKEYREKAKEEFADLLHFVMSIGIDIYDGGVNEMYKHYLKKNSINIERQNNKY